MGGETKSESKRESKVALTRLDEARPIKTWEEVRVTQMNHVVEVLRIAIEPKNLGNLRKLNKTEYVNIETGEIFEYKLNENRGQNIAGLKKTFKVIRNIINNNFTGASNELFVTLTYAENMTDTEKLYRDFEVYMKRMRRRYPDVEYMCIIEPQARGAWHCHVLLKFVGQEKIYINNDDEMALMWGHGWTKTKSLKDVDNIGAYLNAYLTDVEVCEENEQFIFDALIKNRTAWDKVEDEQGNVYKIKMHDEIKMQIVEKEVIEDGQKVKKQYIKGARLHMYPSGMNLYRCSRGIKKPETEKMLYGEAKKIVGPGPANYSRTIDLNRDGEVINSITYEQYNRRRGKSQ